MSETTKEDRIVFGLDDATPTTIDSATKRRMEMWESLNLKIAKLPEAFATIKTLLVINIFTQLFLAATLFYK